MASNSENKDEAIPIYHRFLCDHGATLCSEIEAKVFLRHLDLKVPFLAVDDSTVPFIGKVVIGGTGNDAPNKRMSGPEDQNPANGIGSKEGCPIMGAKVCLVDKHVSGPDVTTAPCVETDANGVYSIPAVIGTTVVAEVSYENHTFAPLYPDLDLEERQQYENGFHISDDKSFTNINFRDMTTATIHVEVAGGLCNKQIGISTVRFNVLNCGTWHREAKQVSAGWTIPVLCFL